MNDKNKIALVYVFMTKIFLNNIFKCFPISHYFKLTIKLIYLYLMQHNANVNSYLIFNSNKIINIIRKNLIYVTLRLN